MSMRKEKAKKQSKFKHYILTPLRILKKAKESYVKGVVDCAGALSVGVRSPVQIISHHPQTQTQIRSVNRSRPNVQRDLLSSVPIKNMGNQTRLLRQSGNTIIVPTISSNVGNETRAVMHKRINVGYKYNRMKMSYLTEVRKMGTIDEDKPCYFEEDQNASNSKPNLLYLYPRSRVCVFDTRAGCYH